MEKVYLSRMKHLLPPHQDGQNELNDWILEAHQRSAELTGEVADWERLKKYFVGANSIAKRNSFISDFKRSWKDAEVYQLMPDHKHGVDILKRAQTYQKNALNCLENLYPAEAKVPDHLIHVTCTGYISPSAPQKYFANSPRPPAVTHAYHMGCYAALPALRMGHAFVKSNEFETVDIVHIEQCSLHMSPQLHTPEQIIVQSLFADGVIAYQLTKNKPSSGFEVIMVKEKLIPDSSQDMSWVTSPQGFVMNLSREVPTKIALGLGSFIEEVCSSLKMSWEDLKKRSLFAIHPGGPKILDLAKELLEASPEQMEASYDVLKSHGNMSSATLPHIWEKMLEKETQKEFVLSLAFGPGLTIFGSMMRRV